MSPTEVVVVSAVRTPIGNFGGSLRDFTAAQLGAVAARAAIARSGIEPRDATLCIFGNARAAGAGPNPARQIGRRSGLPDSSPAFTVNQACASGMKAVELGWQEIALGRHDCVLVGGVEAMSRVPYLAEDVRWGARMGNHPLVDAMYRDGYLCPLSEMVMGETAERLAEQYRISREEQDEYALRSQQRANDAMRSGRLRDDIVAVEITGKDGTQLLEQDEHPRADSSREKLARLSAVFKPGGTVTAGNASGIADGATALVLTSSKFARERGLKAMARILGSTTAGVDPAVMGIGPVPAVTELIKRLDQRLDAFELVELNEAFAAQVIACDRELHFDATRLNVNGGAIALGHHTGCSGARIVVTLIHELQRRGGGAGLATLCASGGMGMAMALDTRV
jgi:acetyl-CoA C-acetyltransferase